MAAQVVEPEHGTRQRYQWKKGPCRCEPCRRANSEYMASKRKGGYREPYLAKRREYEKARRAAKAARLKDELGLDTRAVARDLEPEERPKRAPQRRYRILEGTMTQGEYMKARERSGEVHHVRWHSHASGSRAAA